MRYNRNKLIYFIFFPVLFVYMELVFHIAVYKELCLDSLYALAFAIAYGAIASAICHIFGRKVNKIIAWIITVLTAVYFGLQIVYRHIFSTYITLYSVTQNAGDAAEFWKEALHGIIACIPELIFLLVIPCVALGLFLKFDLVCGPKVIPDSEENIPKKYKVLQNLIVLSLGIFIYLMTVFSLPLNGREAHTQYDLYNGNWILDLGVEKLGVMTSLTLDIGSTISGEEDIYIEETSGLTELVIPEKEETRDVEDEGKTEDSTDVTGEEEAEPTPSSEPVTVTPTPTPVPVDTSPNVLDIDFEKLAEECNDSNIKAIHEYIANTEPTKKNEYTGMFEGYNLIYMTCEGFSPWAVDEKLTPTLYKLVNSGFIFKNFYTPIWYTSTSDGEYVECMSLLPYNTNSFKRSKNNALPMCLGWQMLKEGYTSRAYHAHSGTYYGRNETHPNLGYDFKAKRLGLPITDQWPESDLEMMELSVPDYIKDEKFHVYYMTVSGHLEYGYNDNAMAVKNKHLVDDLPYSEPVKAYISCNIELDRALEYLISELEKAGIADKTVIAFGADHYPYGLTLDEINEVAGHEVEQQFELYKNYFVLWSASIEEPIVIDKYCSSMDMLPTISNLFGLEYDSRLLMGQDILSDAPALVMFSNQSFITDYCMYNAKTKEVIPLYNIELPESYISNVAKIVKNKFEVSKNILLNDYYKYIMDYIPDVVTTRPVY